MEIILLSTTSKHKKDILELPRKKVLKHVSENYLISSKKYLHQFIEEKNNENRLFIVDCEKKQNISLYDELNSLNININLLDYKPNDLTMEAADLALFNYFFRDISNKSIAIYGTGNIAFKLALRLSERNANVYLYGRDQKKVQICVEALRQITFDGNLIHYGTDDTKVDSLVSCVSAHEVIDVKYLQILNKSSLCLDGGIGNFSKKFIELSLEKGHEVRRLDVRQSQEIMDGYIKSRMDSEFDSIIGKDIINDQPVVAGGILGRNGEIIIDNISKPSKVIGIANGIGGVKSESELSDEEREKIKKVEYHIQ
ncbi:hypothetical protein [Salinicoccus halodurans]|uniref:Quinate/shikimate 5-dehydrogenase/glutamyl-tRNA reductase domain-containing protein n=1 Tax=Salinicoccus halodurans TaxID=407035 RepID=A0A0F7HIX7_9STAP|nr:hypothetical protein [Salinicoccus halodurans]AKG73464.1 hypothetical protein AAT16_04085 [Salinicoccus halodurans]SFK50980.1 hypothetical protein SAMN05216235_0054 [Salinicoccus halodurans]